MGLVALALVAAAGWGAMRLHLRANPAAELAHAFSGTRNVFGFHRTLQMGDLTTEEWQQNLSTWRREVRHGTELTSVEVRNGKQQWDYDAGAATTIHMARAENLPERLEIPPTLVANYLRPGQTAGVGVHADAAEFEGKSARRLRLTMVTAEDLDTHAQQSAQVSVYVSPWTSRLLGWKSEDGGTTETISLPEQPYPDSLFHWEIPVATRQVELRDWFEPRRATVRFSQDTGAGKFELHAVDVGSTGAVWVTFRRPEGNAGKLSMLEIANDLGGTYTELPGSVFSRDHLRLTGFLPVSGGPPPTAAKLLTLRLRYGPPGAHGKLQEKAWTLPLPKLAYWDVPPATAEALLHPHEWHGRAVGAAPGSRESKKPTP